MIDNSYIFTCLPHSMILKNGSRPNLSKDETLIPKNEPLQIFEYVLQYFGYEYHTILHFPA